MNEEEIDAALAAQSEQELRQNLKTAMLLLGELMQFNSEFDVNMRQFAGHFSQIGVVYGNQINTLGNAVKALTQRLQSRTN